MGGFGSGRPRSADKIEDYRVLDVSAMHKAGCFAGTRWGSWVFSSFNNFEFLMWQIPRGGGMLFPPVMTKSHVRHQAGP